MLSGRKFRQSFRGRERRLNFLSIAEEQCRSLYDRLRSSDAKQKHLGEIATIDNGCGKTRD